jgi:hypothetical protein
VVLLLALSAVYQPYHLREKDTERNFRLERELKGGITNIALRGAACKPLLNLSRELTALSYTMVVF